MKKSQIVAIRDNAKKNNKQIFLCLNNSLIFYDGQRDCESLIWDDTNELVTVMGPIRENMPMGSHYRKAETPYEVFTFGYDIIEGIGVYMNYENLSKEVATMVAKGTINEARGNEILKDLAPLSRANVNSIERTMRTYSQEDYKKYLEEKSKN